VAFQGSSIVDLVKMTCKDVEEMGSTSILIHRLAMVSNFIGNVLALMLFTIYDIRTLCNESSEATKRLKKLEAQRTEKERQKASIEAQAEQLVIGVFEVEKTPEARAARRLKNRNRSESKLQSLRNVASAATNAASNSQAALTLLNLDRGKLWRAVTFYTCVWLYVFAHLSVIYGVDVDPAQEREILMPIGTCL
jgi:flagellar biogenesis protein FliO